MNRVKRTSDNIIRHELIGLPVNASSTTQNHDVTGIVVNETRNTLIVETADQEEKTLPKTTYTFTFTLPETNENITVTGALLEGRPAERLKKTFPGHGHGDTP